MIAVIAALVMLDVVAVGGGVRYRMRSRRTRRPSRADVAAHKPDPDPSWREHSHTERSVDERRTMQRSVRSGVLVLAAIGGIVALGPTPVLAVVGCVIGTKRLKSIRATRCARLDIERTIPDAVELFVLLIHAGLTPVLAIRELAIVAPGATRAGFAAVVHRLERGDELSDALAALPQHLGSGTVVLADLIAGADRSGTPLAPVLESLALEARAVRRRRGEADARRLPVRLSFPLVACTLPSFVLLAIAPAVIAALSSISVSV